MQEKTAAEIVDFVKMSIEFPNEPLPIVLFADRINALLFQCSDKCVRGKKIADYLLEQGYLELETVDNRNSRVSSAKGRAIGISTSPISLASGAVAKQNFYSPEAQAFIIDRLVDIIEW